MLSRVKYVVTCQVCCNVSRCCHVLRILSRVPEQHEATEVGSPDGAAGRGCRHVVAGRDLAIYN